MGASWVIENTELSFKCGVEHFPSSTRPELMAILTALLAVPLHAIVTIYTDSQAAIDGINGILQMNSSRRIFKMANSSLLGVIKQLISAKSLNFKLEKVKGHSGVEGNDKADRLAKEAAGQVKEGTLGIVTLVDSEVGYGIDFNVTWNKVVIDSDLRKFNRLVCNGIADSQWSLASIWESPAWNDTWISKSKHSLYAWHLWWKLLKNLNHFHCKSFRLHRKLAFIIKLTHNLLPTIDKLRDRNPCYANLKCPMCEQVDETVKHFATCCGSQQAWSDCEDAMIKRVFQYL